MNPPTSPETRPDRDLSRLLQAWQVDGTLPSGFASSVQRRIATDTQRPSLLHYASSLVLRMLESLRRPAFAAAYVALGVALGALSGLWHAETRSLATRESLRHHYIASIDPYQMNRPTP